MIRQKYVELAFVYCIVMRLLQNLTWKS